MAQLPKQKKIIPEDFPKEKFMPQLLQPINEFFETVTSALNKNLTFKENIASEILTVNIDGVFPIKLKWENKNRAVSAWLGSCRETSGTHVALITPLYLDWEMNSAGQFQINNIVGLTASSSNKFTATIIAITG